MLADLPCIASTWAEQFPSRSQQPDVYSRIGNKSWPVIMDDQNSPQFKQKGKLIGPDYYECELWLYVISRPIYSSIAFFVLFLHYLWQGVGLLLGLGRISSLKPGYLAMFDWPPFFGWPVKHCPLTPWSSFDWVGPDVDTVVRAVAQYPVIIHMLHSSYLQGLVAVGW